MKLVKLILCAFSSVMLLLASATALADYVIGDDYPYSGGAIDALNTSTNFYTRECTDFVAHCLRTRNGVAFTNQYAGLGRWGHAGDWIASGQTDSAQAAGVIVDNTPAVGAVACWAKKSEKDTGHVAWVVSVDGNNVTIEEYNAATADNGWTSYIWARRTIAASSPSAYIHIKDIDTTPPEIYTTLDIYDVSSEGFTISFYAMDNIGVDKVYAVIKPTPSYDETLSNKTVFGVIDNETNKATIRVNIDDNIGYLGESYRITCYVEDAAGNTDVYPSRGKMLYLYKIDTSDTGRYRVLHDTVVRTAPRNTVNGYNTSAYTLESNSTIDDVWGSYTENGIKWYRFGKAQWVLAGDVEKKDGNSTILELLDSFLQKLVYIIDGQPVYASEKVDDPVELSGGHVSWVYKPRDVGGNYQSGEDFVNFENEPYELTLITQNGVTGFCVNSYYGDDTELTLPATIGGYPVIAINAKAFEDDDELRSIAIPDSVISIGEKAFYSCSNLTSVRMPNAITEIPESAFEECRNLTEINIPESVKKIWHCAFNHCDKLELYVPENLEYVGVGAFGYDSPYSRVQKVWCRAGTSSADLIDRIVSPNYPDYCVNQSTSSDGTKRLGIVRYLKDEDDVNVPSEIDGVPVRFIWYNVFRGKSLSSITMPETLTGIDEKAFASCINLTSIVIPDSVTSLGESIFYGCKNLETIHLPTQLTIIPSEAFEECRKLVDINIPESVKRIESRAFNYCLALEVCIPDSLEYVGVGCFGYDSPNSRVKSVLCHAGTQASVLVDQFVSPSTPEFKLSQTNTSDGYTLTILKYLGTQSSIVIPTAIDSVPVTALGYRAFTSTSAKDITIMNNIVTIDSTAFNGVSGLTIRGMPGSYIEEYATQKKLNFVSLLTKIEPSIILPSSLLVIDDEAFIHCTSFVSVRVPSTVTSIGHKAFSECANLAQIEIPSSVTYIAPDAFDTGTSIIIFCEAGSNAEQNANENGFTCVTSW